jgi:hypothetical protein
MFYAENALRAILDSMQSAEQSKARRAFSYIKPPAASSIGLRPIFLAMRRKLQAQRMRSILPGGLFEDVILRVGLRSICYANYNLSKTNCVAHTRNVYTKLQKDEASQITSIVLMF